MNLKSKSENSELIHIVNEFFQQIDIFKGRSMAIVATNFEQSLDYAIWRHFDSIVRFDMPDNNDRIKLFNQTLRRFQGSDEIFTQFIDDIKDFSYSDIKKSALSVIKLCILDGRHMYTKKDIEQAITQQKTLVSFRNTQY
jgi:AAA+ superfamily predicted ATPase